LTVRLAGSDGLRHTPSGLPTLRLRVVHTSQQPECGRSRAVEMETEVVAFGDTARGLAHVPMGKQARLCGFLDRRGVKNPTLELHVTEFELFSPD
jgi:primosomal replication protein N